MTDLAKSATMGAVSASTSPRAWRGVLDVYAKPRLSRSLADLATSVLPYLVLMVVMTILTLNGLWPVALLFVIPAAGFLLRTFIVFHDCTHGSFMRTRRANDVIGTLLGLLVWMPYRAWQHEHAVHHATAGNLDRRGIGDITTLTVAEYQALPLWRRVGYRLFRNPFVMFGLGWLLVLVLKPRFVPKGSKPKVRNSIIATNIELAVIVTVLCYLIGWQTYLLVQVPVFLVTGAVGIFLFYVQHQFEDTYWQSQSNWRYDHAALEGSSYLRLPRVLQFFTGNIGFHHVHHLSVAIPNYNLQAAHEQTDGLKEVPELTLREAFRAPRLKLWDEQHRRLVTFADART